ncbi:hypothetical protein [Rhodoplanes sp. Z2-YC6860]|uniref:hypothetical protein n=1 Tax=Rhodoplanes sp. Z2-YC6860 TaxID=674703 RepID=UPI00082C4AFB|nr:hypothetical protein [Rhodoplanes sp. Z2-YC6860]
MSAAKARKAKPARTKAKAKVKRAKVKSTKVKRAGPKSAKTKTDTRRAKPTSAAPQMARPFRFTAAHTVQIRFPGEKKPENFRVDDMVEATIATLSGEKKLYYQYRLVSNDKTGPGGAERHFWFFDPKPVGLPDPIGPSLWAPTDEQTVDGHEVVGACSGNFSTRSVTSYDGSGSRHVVKLGGEPKQPKHRMRLELNGKREFCESLEVTVGKNDMLTVAG